MSRIKDAFDEETKKIEVIKNQSRLSKSVNIPMIFLNNTFGIKGILIDSPYANWMWRGKKSHIISKKDTTHMVNKAIYLCDKENIYGVIRLHYPNKITFEQLTQRKEFHLMSNEDIEKMKDTDIFEYSYDWIHKFDPIMMWNFSKSKQDEFGFVENVEFIEETKEEKKEKEYSNSINAIVIDKSFDNNGKEIYHLGLEYDNKSSGKIVDVSGKKFFFIGRARKSDVKVPIGSMVRVLFDKASKCKLCDRIEIQKPYIKEASYEEKASLYSSLPRLVEDEKTKDIEISHTSILSSSLPPRMKRNLTKIMESKIWMPYAMHFHSEGATLGVHVGLFVPSEDYGKVLTYFDAEELCEKDKLEGVIEGFSLSVKEGIGIDYSKGRINNPEKPHPIFANGIFGDVLCVPLAQGIYAINEVSDSHFGVDFKSDKNVHINPLLLSEITKIMPFEDTIRLNDSYILKLQPNGSVSFEKSRTIGRNSSVTPLQMQKIYILRDTMSIKEMSNEIGLSGKTICMYRKKMGIN